MFPEPTDEDLQKVAAYLNFEPGKWERQRWILRRVFRRAQHRATVMAPPHRGRPPIDVWPFVAEEAALMMRP